VAIAGGEGLRASGAVIDAVLSHARAVAPDECCGMLVGAGDRIDAAVPARNVAERPASRFLIEPRDHLAALREARARGLDVIGFYHSHPRGDAVPSATDLAEASYPDHLFLIVGLGVEPPDVRLYRFAAGNFLPLRFVKSAE
jgi:proteasome lid subunit RPN8/RPN11